MKICATTFLTHFVTGFAMKRRCILFTGTALMTTTLSLISLLLPVVAQAETFTIDFNKAVEMANNADHRIGEKEKQVAVAEGLLQEAQGAKSWIFDTNTFLGMSPKIRSADYIKDNGEIDRSALDFAGVGPWLKLDFTVVKPITTFGKVEHYSEAARNNILLKQGDVQVQRGKTYIDVATAYNGFLAARDLRLLLEDARDKVHSALDLTKEWLEADNGQAKQSDQYALETGAAIIEGYLEEAGGTEKVAMAGLRMLTGIADADQLAVADKRLEAWPLPDAKLKPMMAKALSQRPEMAQVSAGLAARRALLEANRSEAYPNIYYGIGGLVSYSPLRESTADLSVYDSFNTWGATPVIGMKWDWYSGRQRAKVAQAQAEYDVVLETKAFALQGIPFQVAEAFHNVHLNYEKVQRLYNGARSGRRWLIATYADFEAGIEQSDKLTAAFQGYLLAYSEYVKSVNNYNVELAKLRVAIGDVK